MSDESFCIYCDATEECTSTCDCPPCVERFWGVCEHCGFYLDNPAHAESSCVAQPRQPRVPPPNVVPFPASAEKAVRDAAEDLRSARVLYAEHWVMAKSGLRGIKAPTDETATQMTIAATKDEITTLEAEYRIALAGLK